MKDRINHSQDHASIADLSPKAPSADANENDDTPIESSAEPAPPPLPAKSEIGATGDDVRVEPVKPVFGTIVDDSATKSSFHLAG